MNKKLLLSALMCGMLLTAHGQFTVNQLPVVLDSLTGNFLCSVPREAFDAPYQATLNLVGDQWNKLFIGATKVSPVGKYTFASIDSARVFPLTAIAGRDTLHYGLTFTWHPILMLNALEGEFNTDYKASSVVFIAPGEMATEPLASKAKWKGNTTVRYEREKRNYHLKFLDEEGNKADVKFFPDLRSDNNWLLDAGQVDNARIRNKAGMDLWMDLVPPMYYADQEPKAINGVRSHIVEVFLDGKYHGFYSMSESMDRKQLKLKKFDEKTKEVHGQLWKTFLWNDYTLMAAELPDRTTAHYKVYYGYEPKYPDIDDVFPIRLRELVDAVNFVVNSSDEEFKAHVAEYFDIPVLKAYVILYQLLLAWDNGGKNMNWAIYDREQDKKLTFVAWDFDATVGQDYINLKNVDEAKISPERNLKFSHRLFRRLIDMNVDGFKTDVTMTYYRLRKTLLREDSLVNRYVGLIEKLQHSGAAQRETKRWSGVVDLYYRDLDFDYQKQYIADWWHRRLAFLDEKVFKVTPVYGDVNRDLVVDVEDVNAVLNVMLHKSTFDTEADINGDGAVDVDDLNGIISIMIHKLFE